MRLFNQTKNQLGWSLGDVAYSCEPWGAVDVPEDVVKLTLARGLPLDFAPVSAEQRAHQRISDEQEASKADALRALKGQADSAQAAGRAVKEELGRCQVELSSARDSLRDALKRSESLADQLSRMKADKDAAEQLLAQESTRATDAETRAIRAEALLSEAHKPAQAKPKAAARAD